MFLLRRLWKWPILCWINVCLFVFLPFFMFLWLNIKPSLFSHCACTCILGLWGQAGAPPTGCFGLCHAGHSGLCCHQGKDNTCQYNQHTLSAQWAAHHTLTYWASFGKEWDFALYSISSLQPPTFFISWHTILSFYILRVCVWLLLSFLLQFFGMLSVCVITCKTSQRSGYQPLYAWDSSWNHLPLSCFSPLSLLTTCWELTDILILQCLEVSKFCFNNGI